MRDEDQDEACRCRECGEYITFSAYRRDGFCEDCRVQARRDEEAQERVMDREEWEAFRFGKGEGDDDEL